MAKNKNQELRNRLMLAESRIQRLEENEEAIVEGLVHLQKALQAINNGLNEAANGNAQGLNKPAGASTSQTFMGQGNPERSAKSDIDTEPDFDDFNFIDTRKGT